MPAGQGHTERPGRRAGIRERIRRAMRTTAVRLTVLYTLLFGILAAGVVIYISFQTGRLIISQIRTTVSEEVRELARVSQSGGLRRLVFVVDRRSRLPGANLYLIVDGAGRILAGNVADVDRTVLARDGWSPVPFQYERFDGETRTVQRAIARVFRLPGDLRLLVGRDLGDASRFRTVVFRATTGSIAVMLLTGLIVWFFVARRALAHVDRVGRTSRRIIAGDLSQRLPLSGSGDEFDRLSLALNEALERIERLDASARSISDNIAHDLRTPLTRLRNRAEALVEAGPAAPAAETACAIVAEADGIIRTFEALLTISRVESGSSPARTSPVELDHLVRDVFELFEPVAEERSVRLQLTKAEPVTLEVNRELVAQALTNLLDNALKYAGEPGRTIDVSLDRHGPDAVLIVADDGPGISPEARDTALRRFGRLDASRNEPGDGLGLSLVTAIASVHGGRLELDDNAPGLVARLVLPMERR